MVLIHDLAWGICSMLVRGVCGLPLVSGLFSCVFYALLYSSIPVFLCFLSGQLRKFGTEDPHLLLYCRLLFILLGGPVVDSYIFIIVLSSAKLFINVWWHFCLSLCFLFKLFFVWCEYHNSYLVLFLFMCHVFFPTLHIESTTVAWEFL